MTTVTEHAAQERLVSVNTRSLGQRIARLDHYFQARFRNRFGPVARLLEKWIPERSTLLDIGANHGKFTKNLARARNGSCAVVAFEPLEYNYTLLESVVRPFPNVRVIRCALADKPGEADFFIPVRPNRRISPGAAHLGDAAHETSFGTATARSYARQRVQVDTLDQVARRERFGPVGFIKIDAQGAETLVFRGARETLAIGKPAIWCELCPGCPETLGLTVNDAVEELRERGYRMFTLDLDTGDLSPRQRVDTDVRDYLFLHPQRHPEAAAD